MNSNSFGADARELYAFGQNGLGELGLGDALDRHAPALVESSVGKAIVHVTAGNEFTAALTDTGEVYSCGYNHLGQCGVGEMTRYVPSFTKICLEEPRFSSRGRVSLVQSGNGAEHLCIVSEDGELHTCGSNARRQLGRMANTDNQALPRPVPQLEGYRVTQVACSRFHTAIVTDDDQVWTFGANSHGQLGLGDLSDRDFPSPVSTLRGQGSSCVACGASHTLVSTENGAVYGFGDNDRGQIGLQERQPHAIPMRLGAVDDLVHQVACGYYHSVLLTTMGEVLTFGRNDYGQLGLGHVEDTRNASKVTLLKGRTIVQVACGSFHTICLDDEGRVYPFGRNQYGQLGTGTTEDSCRPGFVEKLFGKFVCQVAAGFYHTLCLTGPPLVQRGSLAMIKAKRAAEDAARRVRTLSSDLYQLLNNPAGSDVTFEVEGNTIHGHRWRMRDTFPLLNGFVATDNGALLH